MASEIHVGDIGTVIKISIEDDGAALDISSSTAQNILVLKPDGSTETWVAEFDDDGVDGVIAYTTTSGDIDMPGIWYLQAKLSYSGAEVTFAAHQRILVHQTVN